MKEKWQSFFPPGGPIPPDAQSFFSPGFLWTRLPLGKESDRLIKEKFFLAFQDYLTLYMMLLKDSLEVSIERSEEILSGQKRYMEYRSAKDPARSMLKRFYGEEWTEKYISEILFKL